MAAAIDTMNQICDWRGSAEDFLAFASLAAAGEQFELSEKAYIWAATLAPETWQAHCELAELYDSLNRTDEAAKHFNAAIQINRTSYLPHNSLAMFFVKHGQLDSAIKHL